MELKLHPDLKSTLMKTTIVVLSGSDRSVLHDNFCEYNMWLAAENGMFLRITRGEWVTTMPKHINIDWVDSVKHVFVFEYFTNRTPRSHFDTSLVWNYKYADVEFGKLQARDMLQQHLLTGPISNASVDVVQGSQSVEVRTVGVTKGAAIGRILGQIAHSKPVSTPIDYVLCIGHFLGKDEVAYTFFEPEIPDESMLGDDFRLPGIKLQKGRNVSKPSKSRSPRPPPSPENTSDVYGSGRQQSSEKISWDVLGLKAENYFSCAVGRSHSTARYLLETLDDVVSVLKGLAAASSSS